MHTRSEKKMYFFLCSWGWQSGKSGGPPLWVAVWVPPTPLPDRHALLRLSVGCFLSGPELHPKYPPSSSLFFLLLFLFLLKVVTYHSWFGVRTDDLLVLSMSLHLHLQLPYNWWVIEVRVDLGPFGSFLLCLSVHTTKSSFFLLLLRNSGSTTHHSKANKSRGKCQ